MSHARVSRRDSPTASEGVSAASPAHVHISFNLVCDGREALAAKALIQAVCWGESQMVMWGPELRSPQHPPHSAHNLLEPSASSSP